MRTIRSQQINRLVKIVWNSYGGKKAFFKKNKNRCPKLIMEQMRILMRIKTHEY